MITSENRRHFGVVRATACAATLLLGVAFAAPAAAVTYFDGPGGFGFDNEARKRPLQPGYVVDAPGLWRPAGSPSENDGSFDVVLRSKQTIKERDGFFRVRVKWKLKNKSGRTLPRALVAFTALGGPPNFPDYSDIKIDLDLTGTSAKTRLDIVQFEGENDSLFFAGFVIEDFETGKKGQKTRIFRYDIKADELPDNRGPAIGVNSVRNVSVVPEPSTMLLLGLGLGGFAWARKRT